MRIQFRVTFEIKQEFPLYLIIMLKKILFILCFSLAFNSVYSQVNWADVTKEFSDNLKKESDRREAKKQYYDNYAYESIRDLDDYTSLTGNKAADDKIIELFNTAEKKIDFYNRMLKAGHYGRNTNQYILDIDRYVLLTKRSYNEIIRGY